MDTKIKVTPAQRKALQEVRALYGDDWKAELVRLWEAHRWPWALRKEIYLLLRVRKYGTEWLDSYQLPE